MPSRKSHLPSQREALLFLSHREVLKKNTTQQHNVDITLSPEEERHAEVQRRSG
jgi:hypothetical protein